MSACAHDLHYSIACTVISDPTHPQLERAFAAYNQDIGKLQELKEWFKAATDAGCAHSCVYKQVDDLLKAMETVMSEFKDISASGDDSITYKIWDLGGQKVCVLVLETIRTC